VTGEKTIWVLPEIGDDTEEISKLSLGLLSEAVYIAKKADGTVTAIVFSDVSPEISEVLASHGIANAYVYKDPLFNNISAEACAAALLPVLREEKPWLLLMGNTVLGRELVPRLAVLLESGAVTGCARMELSNPDEPRFYRFIYGDQLFQEAVFRTDDTMLVTMDPRVLNVTPATITGEVKIRTIEPKLSPDSIKLQHLEYLPADYQTVDISEADTVISAGMGAATDELLPLVEELAGLLEGSIGTTRPVIDSGKIPRERMIGQTGKVVGPGLYMALGISGASHHVGGIQDSGKIVSINRDPLAPVFRSSDIGVTVDLADVLPKLIEKIKRAKSNDEIL
jgi:electron transfer flavoprotein alpha subunit